MGQELEGPFWVAANQGKLLCQQCDQCSEFFFPPEMLCTGCSSSNWTWRETAGEGRIDTFTVVYRQVLTELPAPFVLAVVQLNEGFRMLTNVVSTSPAAIDFGMLVRVAFRQSKNGRVVPVFVPRTEPL